MCVCFPSCYSFNYSLSLSLSLTHTHRSELAVTLKKRMKELVAKHPVVEPPPLDLRRPKPLPKKLPIPLKPVEILQTSKYQYLG